MKPAVGGCYWVCKVNFKHFWWLDFHYWVKLCQTDFYVLNFSTYWLFWWLFFSGFDENGPIFEKFCGNNTIPAPRVTPSEQVWVRFRTDRSIVDTGFAVTFQSTCEWTALLQICVVCVLSTVISLAGLFHVQLVHPDLFLCFLYECIEDI